MTAREMTTQECQETFLASVRQMVAYWETVEDRTVRQRLDGLAFSILAMLDGASCGVPAWIVAPMPHLGDRAFRQAECENWWPDNDGKGVVADIAGGLHERYYR